MSAVLDVFDKMLEIYKDPSAWTRCANAKNAHEKPVPVNDVTACSFCLAGCSYRAMHLLDITPNNGYETHQIVFSILRDSVPPGSKKSLQYFNDTLANGFEDVLKVVKKARAKAKKQLDKQN
jgi:hypothetical protein